MNSVMQVIEKEQLRFPTRAGSSKYVCKEDTRKDWSQTGESLGIRAACNVFQDSRSDIRSRISVMGDRNGKEEYRERILRRELTVLDDLIYEIKEKRVKGESMSTP